jgi:hypothetical protein
MTRRILRNLSLFRIVIMQLSFAIFRTFAYTADFAFTQTKDLRISGWLAAEKENSVCETANNCERLPGPKSMEAAP